MNPLFLIPILFVSVFSLIGMQEVFAGGAAEEANDMFGGVNKGLRGFLDIIGNLDKAFNDFRKFLWGTFTGEWQ